MTPTSRLYLVLVTIVFFVTWREVWDDASTVEVIFDIDKKRLITMHDAHRRGMPHHGVWVYAVKSATCELLLQQRSENAATCPSSVSLLGEHTRPGEDVDDTVLRGLSEEMNWVNVNKSAIEVFNVRVFNYTYPNGLIDVQTTAETLCLLRDDIEIHKHDLEFGEVHAAWFETIGAFQARLEGDSSAICNQYLTRFVKEGIELLCKHHSAIRQCCSIT